LRFDVDAPIEFLKQFLSDFEKPKLEAKLVRPKPTGLKLIEENLAEVIVFDFSS